jgi:hypothetical protein
MPIVAVFDFPGQSLDQYENVFKEGGAAINDQPRRRSHVCYPTANGFTVVDVWDDEVSFAAFGAIIGPATAKAGLDAQPVVHEVQGYMGADGIRNP